MAFIKTTNYKSMMTDYIWHRVTTYKYKIHELICECACVHLCVSYKVLRTIPFGWQQMKTITEIYGSYLTTHIYFLAKYYYYYIIFCNMKIRHSIYTTDSCVKGHGILATWIFAFFLGNQSSRVMYKVKTYDYIHYIPSGQMKIFLLFSFWAV